MELGADDYLPKPFTTEGLYAAVDARLKKSQTIRDEAERKLASLRDNISLMMPHEMRTPLNGILSNAEMLANSAATLKPGDVAEIGQEIHKSSERLARLIENFLIYAQLELVAADPKNVNALRVGRTEHPTGLIKHHAAAQATHANRLPDLSFELADIPLPIAEEYLSKIMDELLQNAFKFSTADSPVRVTLDEAPQGGAVTLSVSDKGRGFTAEQITRIGAYMQFDRKLHEQQGLGLGLTIAKRLVELHGGKFSIVSDKDSGTVISAKFPKTKVE
jgi:signal transduction histidine kinase